MEKEILLEVSEDQMKNKQYSLRNLIASFFIPCEIVKQGRAVSKREYSHMLKRHVGVSDYKRRKSIECYKDLQMIIEDKKHYIFVPIKTRFVALTRETGKNLLFENEMTVKVYCYLLNKYNINRRYNLSKDFCFSKASLLKSLGYSATKSKSYEKIADSLERLKELRLIEYEVKNYDMYMTLIKVNQYGG